MNAFLQGHLDMVARMAVVGVAVLMAVLMAVLAMAVVGMAALVTVAAA